MSPAGKPHGPLVALSTASVFPDRTPDAFEVAARLGYDGMEVMVSTDAVSQDVDVLRRLVDYHGIPVLAIHAPCLLITQRVWGREPWAKLTKSAAVAEKLGARVVVVHPPFRWQRDYAREFAAGLERLRDETGITFAVENMYPLRAGGAEVAPYSPHWNPVQQDYPDVTLDLSHTSVSGSDAMTMAADLGDRLAHVHLADGTGLTNRDEHLVPGRGVQPCAPLLEKLAAERYTGAIVLEVNTRRASSREARRADLAEALDFTRRHLTPGGAGAGGWDAGAAADGTGPGRRAAKAKGAASGQGEGSRPARERAVSGRRSGTRRAGRGQAGGRAADDHPAAGGPGSGQHGAQDPGVEAAGNGNAAGDHQIAAPGHGTGTGQDRSRTGSGQGGPGAGSGQGGPGAGTGQDQDGEALAGRPDGDAPAARRVAGRVRSLGRAAVSRPAARGAAARKTADSSAAGPLPGAGQGTRALALRRWRRLDDQARQDASCRS